MTTNQDELLLLTRSLREQVKWDGEEGTLGYPPMPPVQPIPGESSLDPNLPPTAQERPKLDELQLELGDCHRCKLCEQGRKNIVFGEGNPNADLVFVGEGPGFHEDRLGRPFVGPAGELLDKMILAMGLERKDVYICNVVKCRPPKNRDPEPDEVLACQPFLRAQLASVQPKVVVAMGRFAAQTLLDTAEGIGRLRGNFHPFLGMQLMPTFHPAYLLRNPADKRKVWADLKAVMGILGLDKPQ